MAKCKKGEIWDKEIGKCRTSSLKEKVKMAGVKQAKSAALSFGIPTGAAAGAALGSRVGKPLIGGLLGAAVGGYRAYKKQGKTVDYDVPSRKIPRKRKKKKK